MVRLAGAGLRYPSPGGGGAWALKNLSFALAGGSFTWLLGASGAGKSSLLRLLHLSLRATEGEVEVLGAPVGRLRRAALPALRRRIGVVFQDYRLLPHLSAFENVALPLRIAGVSDSRLRADVSEMLRWVGLEHRGGEAPFALSGGEQQRLALARALLLKPDWLFLDEATASLDPEAEARFYALLKERLPGATLVSIAHRPAVAQYHQRALRVREGQLAAGAV